ncbi:hypothetical protein SAMN04488103_1102 [Gemmobacter aquatilis]|uniref:DUF4136 domain-containing protein n=1 Tax=Gemmobacter aquatilis TaxID=933059 RepID=A0A1H8KW26_9RHOB|nr:hypothetical protein [Gemmobacter aquatilis]SEN97085.1 hypothetical protein SAMN04488103_1102 [Gemmobacter aquatilis]
MPAIRPALRAAALSLLALAACAKNDLADPPADLGDFVLGLNIVVADKVQKVPISREASIEAWEAAMKQAVDDRFGRYEGSHIYNVGISIDAYALAPPGIPVVAAPKSVLVITANVWDDAKGQKLNAEGKQFTIWENFDGENVIGTGLTRTKEQQMAALSYNAVKAVEGWFLENPQWFGLPPKTAVPPGTKPAPAAGPAGTDTPPAAGK